MYGNYRYEQQNTTKNQISINRLEFKKTLLKKGCSIGANATVVCGITIGKYAFVGAGSIVTKDVPDFALVYGSPAKIKGWYSIAGNRLVFDKKNFAVDNFDNTKYEKVSENKVILK